MSDKTQNQERLQTLHQAAKVALEIEMKKTETPEAPQKMTKAEQYRRELRGLAKGRAAEAREKNDKFWADRAAEEPGFKLEE